MYSITALIFSGRKNPSWQVKDDRLQEAFALFESAATAADQSPAASLLGYNGLQVEKGNKLWHVANGRIFYRLDDKPVLIKTDANGRFEKILLQTAPPDVSSLLRQVLPH